MDLPRVRARKPADDRARINVLRMMSQGEIFHGLCQALDTALRHLPDARTTHPFLRLLEVRMVGKKASLSQLLKLRHYGQCRMQFPELYDVLYDYDLAGLVEDARILAHLEADKNPR